MSIKLEIEALVDSYKIGMNILHNHEMFKGSPTKVLSSYSNFTARKNAYFTFSEHSDEKLVIYGTRHTFKYIHDLFQVFFATPEDEVFERIVIRLTSHFGGNVVVDHKDYIQDIMGLHALGYLPLEIRSINEGTRYPIGLPIFTSKNTLDGYGWLVNNLETLSSNLIYPMINTATIIDQFYQQAKYYSSISAPPEVAAGWLPICVHNFEFRGMMGPEHGMRVGSASCIPFMGSDTIASIDFLTQYYDYNPKTDAPIAVSIRASEHADISRLLSELRYRGISEDTEKTLIGLLADNTTGMFSYVSDTENYFRSISEYALANKDKILSRQDGSNGLPAKWVWRPDSSRLRPLEVICGLMVVDEVDHINEIYWETEKGCVVYVAGEDKYYEVLDVSLPLSFKQELKFTEVSELEVKGSLRILWEVFGGEELDTQAGKMKFLNPKVGVVYGEAISQQHQKEIYERMIELGFSVTNLVIGKGSYANLQNNTRDLFSMSYKQTFSVAEIDGVVVNLEQQKSPMGDVSKKSARGLLMVDSQFNLHQSCTAEEEQSGLLTLLYKDGKFHKEQSIWDIKGNYFK